MSVRFKNARVLKTKPWRHKLGRQLVGVWIGGVWNGHFPESETIFQRPKFAGKSPKFCRKRDFAKFQAPYFEISEPKEMQCQTPSHAVPPLDSLLQTRSSKRAPRELQNWRVQGNRQHCANPSPTLCQPFASPLPTFSANPSPSPSFRGPQARVKTRKRFLHSGWPRNWIGERLRGKTIRGNRTESLREENLPPRGSPRGPPKTSERSAFVKF